jgi:hypothetical protein
MEFAKEALSNAAISTEVMKKLCFTTNNLRFDLKGYFNVLDFDSVFTVPQSLAEQMNMMTPESNPQSGAQHANPFTSHHSQAGMYNRIE